jgi:RND family efflux transporter MFP subunit
MPRRASTRPSPPFALAIAPLLVASVASFAFASAGCKKTQAAVIESRDEAPVSVVTEPVTNAPMPRALPLTGTLRGQREASLAANAVGRVLGTSVERGQEVKAGDPLARLDVRTAAFAAAEAKANAELARSMEETAKRECDRYTQLLASGSISQAEHDRFADQCKTSPLSVRAAEARAATAAQTLSDGTIRAPFAGIIAERFVNAGEYVRQDSKVATLVAIDVMRLSFAVPEVHVGKVKEGSRVRFRVPAHPDRTFEGVVQFVGAEVRQATRDLVVEAVVQNEGRLLRPGMFAAIDLELEETPALVAPQNAILEKAGKHYAFVAVGDRLEQRIVQLGPSKGGLVAVLRGLHEGEALVKEPSPTLQNGQRIAR